MRNIVHWPAADRLVYLHKKATPEFWDQRWVDEGPPPEISPKDDVITVTQKHLSAGSRVLEGGCGRANKVHAMDKAGFNAIGVDFAEQTVDRAKRDFGAIDVRKGDVRALDFPDDYFDGYWSIGVIEHFWDGYDAILSEASRVLKPGGMLFLTAPWFSPYRQKMARSDRFENVDFSTEPEGFYQFALCRAEVMGKLKEAGFDLQYWKGRVSEISMRDDMTGWPGLRRWLFESRGSIFKRVLRRVVSRSMNPYCGHSFLAVARNRG